MFARSFFSHPWNSRISEEPAMKLCSTKENKLNFGMPESAFINHGLAAVEYNIRRGLVQVNKHRKPCVQWTVYKINEREATDWETTQERQEEKQELRKSSAEKVLHAINYTWWISFSSLF